MVQINKQTLRSILGIQAGMRIYLQHVPTNVTHALGDLDDSTSTVVDPDLANFFLYFVSHRSELFTIAEKLQHLDAPSQIVWICWSKKQGKTINEQDLRDALLPIGLVDSKRSDILNDFTGIKFVWRKK